MHIQEQDTISDSLDNLKIEMGGTLRIQVIHVTGMRMLAQGPYRFSRGLVA